MVWGILIGLAISGLGAALIWFSKALTDFNLRLNRRMGFWLPTWAGRGFYRWSFVPVGLGWIAVGILIIVLTITAWRQ